MDLRRLRAGEWVVGISGAVLLVVLFLPWYRVDGSVALDRVVEQIGPFADISAFEAFAFVDVVGALLALAALTVTGLTASHRSPSAPIAAQALLTIFAFFAAAIVVVRVLDSPGDISSGVIDGSTALGAVRTVWAWVGAAAAVGVWAGALLAMRDERLSGDGAPTDATGRPVDRVVEIEALRAPGGGASA